MRPIDDLLKSEHFREVLMQAANYAEVHRLDPWAVRMTWVGLVFGIRVAQRYAVRRSQFRISRAYLCYRTLVEAGIFSEDPDGIVWVEGTEPWESDPLLWFNTLAKIAAGGPIPQGLPVSA